MQTIPPMVMASAPKAGAVQPLTRKIAEVAIRVAMGMPETVLAEMRKNGVEPQFDKYETAPKVLTAAG